MTIATKIIASDLIKRPSESEQLTARLLDNYNNPMGMESLIFTVNGVNYEKTTDNDGYAYLNINLPIGHYRATIKFNAVHVYSESIKSVNIEIVDKYTVHITASDLTKNRENPTKLKAKLTLYNEEPIPNRPLLFQINGVTYTRTTDNNGVAGLNINLPRGQYSCTIISPHDDFYSYESITIQVNVISSTHMDGTNISKM